MSLPLGRSLTRAPVVLVLAAALLVLPGAWAQEETGRESETEGGSAAEGESPAVDLSVDEAIADFEAAWQIVAESYVDSEYNGLDWQEMKEEYASRIA